MGEALNVIIVPILESDLEIVRSVQRYWIRENQPFQDPAGSGSGLDLVYVVSSGENEAFRKAIEEVFDSSGIRQQFRNVSVHFAEIPSELDYYEKETRGMPPTSNGFASGPNEVFFHVAEFFAETYECCFLMELDCLPIRKNWAEQLQIEMSRNLYAWVVGSRYHGWSWLSPRIRDHLNGNAIYRFSDPDFQTFLKEVWKPGVHELQQWGYPDLAYDCFPALLEMLSRGPLVPAELRVKASQVFGRFCESYFVLNLSGVHDRRTEYGELDLLKAQNPNTILIHASWLMDELIETQEITSVEKDDAGKAISETVSESLTYSIKHVFASEGVWVYGNQFAFRRDDSVITLHILVDKKKFSAMTIFAQADAAVPMSIRRWSESFSVGFNLISAIGGVLKFCGLSKLLRLELIRKSVRDCFNRIEYFSRSKALELLRIWVGQLRGRKIASGENEVSFTTGQLKKSNGVIVTLYSTDELVEGTINVRVDA